MATLHLHGMPRLAGSDGRERPLAAREAALLAWLHLQGPGTRAQLAGLLWPGGSEAQARTNLRQLLARLRRHAGALVAEDAGQMRLLAPVAAPDGQPLLGPLPFDDLPEFAAWLQTRRDDEARARQRDQLAAAQRALAAGDLQAALVAADAVLAVQPETEEAWRLRMQVWQRRGDRAAALQAWDECRLALRSAFGISPGAETQALGQQILAGALGAPPVPAEWPAELPVALRHPPRLVGRESALKRLLDGIALGHATWVLGPGGIGKSRLLDALALQAGGALSVAARAGDLRQPGALLARLVEAALRQFDPALDPATRAGLARLSPPPGSPSPPRSAAEHRADLADLARLWPQCRARGLRLLLVDDLQFADEASLEALDALISAWLADDAAVLPVLASRPEGLPPAATALQQRMLASGRCARLELRGLTPPQLRQWLATLALPQALAGDLDALATALHAQLGGNPAWTLESLKSLCLQAAWAPGQAVPVPPTLLEAVSDRLARLSPDAQQLVQLAAVAGTEFSVGLAAAAFGRGTLALAPPLAELERAQVFDGQGFSHELVADAVRRSVPALLAQALHAFTAEYLTGRSADPHAAAGIAHHLERAGRAREAAPWHLQAAEQARGRWQMVAAARAFEAAATGLDAQVDRARAFAAWREAARCWIAASRPQETGRALDAAEALALDARERTLLRSTRTTWLFNTERYVDAAASAQALMQALPQAAAQLDAEELAQALLSASMAAALGTEPDRVLALCDGLRPRAEGSPRLQARLGFAQGLALNALARPLQAAALLQQAWDLAAAHELRGECVNIGNQWLRSLEAQGDLGAALALHAQTLRAARQAGVGAGFEADLLNGAGLLWVASGQPQAGLDGLEQASELLREGAGPAPAPQGYQALRLALAWLMLGQPGRCQALLQATPVPAAGTPQAAYRAWLGWRLHGMQGVQGAPPQPAFLGPADGLLALRQRVVQALAADPARADRAALQALVGLLQARGLGALLRDAHGAAAAAAWAQGDAAAACAHARAALALARCCDPWCDEPAAVWLRAHRVLQACGQTDEEAQALVRGRAWVLEAAAGLREPAARAAWCAGNPVHRALCAGGGAGLG